MTREICLTCLKSRDSVKDLPYCSPLETLTEGLTSSLGLLTFQPDTIKPSVDTSEH